MAYKETLNERGGITKKRYDPLHKLTEGKRLRGGTESKRKQIEVDLVTLTTTKNNEKLHKLLTHLLSQHRLLNKEKAETISRNLVADRRMLGEVLQGGHLREAIIGQTSAFEGKNNSTEAIMRLKAPRLADAFMQRIHERGYLQGLLTAHAEAKLPPRERHLEVRQEQPAPLEEPAAPDSEATQEMGPDYAEDLRKVEEAYQLGLEHGKTEAKKAADATQQDRLKRLLKTMAGAGDARPEDRLAPRSRPGARTPGGGRSAPRAPSGSRPERDSEATAEYTRDELNEALNQSGPEEKVRDAQPGRPSAWQRAKQGITSWNQRRREGRQARREAKRQAQEASERELAEAAGDVEEPDEDTRDTIPIPTRGQRAKAWAREKGSKLRDYVREKQEQRHARKTETKAEENAQLELFAPEDTAQPSRPWWPRTKEWSKKRGQRAWAWTKVRAGTTAEKARTLKQRAADAYQERRDAKSQQEGRVQANPKLLGNILINEHESQAQARDESTLKLATGRKKFVKEHGGFFYNLNHVRKWALPKPNETKEEKNKRNADFHAFLKDKWALKTKAGKLIANGLPIFGVPPVAAHAAGLHAEYQWESMKHFYGWFGKQGGKLKQKVQDARAKRRQPPQA